MNDKPFTLYYVQLKNINSDDFLADTGKISDVKCISKGMTVIGFKENSNHYMIVGDKPNVISMGMVQKIETKNKNIIYIGQRIYSNSQKELYDYIKLEISKRVQYIQKEIVSTQKIKNNLQGSDMYDEYIDRLYKQIKTIQTNFKNLITNLKKV